MGGEGGDKEGTCWAILEGKCRELGVTGIEGHLPIDRIWEAAEIKRIRHSKRRDVREIAEKGG